jgi:SPP1 gp7 family putative phage head morphogenesis protein
MASKTIRIPRDPARAKRLIGQYEKELVALFEEYKQHIVNDLTPGARALATSDKPPYIDGDRMDHVLRDAGNWLAWQGGLIVRAATRKAYMQGQTWSNINLKRMRVEVRGTFFTEADKRAIALMEHRSLAGLKGIDEATSKEIVRVLVDGMRRGDSMDQLANAIVDRVDSIGINRARLLARKETMDALNDGSLNRYVEQGVARVVRVEAMDERCCDFCVSIHGKVYSIEEARALETHPGCRGCWAPAPRGE